MQNCEPTYRSVIEGRLPCDELAQDSKASWFWGYGKWRGCAVKVYVLIWGDLTGLRWSSTAPSPAMVRVTCQKSADGIVAGGHR